MREYRSSGHNASGWEWLLPNLAQDLHMWSRDTMRYRWKERGLTMHAREILSKVESGRRYVGGMAQNLGLSSGLCIPKVKARARARGQLKVKITFKADQKFEFSDPWKF